MDFTKLCCETGRIIYKKSIKQKKLFSFEKFEIIYVGETLIAFSNKEIRKIDIASGQSEIDHELTKKFNVNGVTAYLGNGVSFVSSISSLNQQLEDEAYIIYILLQHQPLLQQDKLISILAVD